MNVGSGEILVVDEATGIRKEIVKYLKSSGFKVKTSSTEVQCLRRIRENSLDLIICILANPSIDLLHFISATKAINQNLPIIVLCSTDKVAEIKALVNSGASDYLPLPLGDLSLLELVILKNLEQNKQARIRRKSEIGLENLNKKLVEKLRILERDQRAGFQVQRGMMPRSPFKVDGITFTHQIIPSLILSGDFIDYFELSDHRLLFYIADVSGHGASSAFVTVLLKNLSRRLYKEIERLELEDTSSILQWLNSELLESEIEQHVTMFLGIVDPGKGKLEYSNAAHFPATILSSKVATEFLEIGGLPLGLYENVNYDVKNLDLPAEFTLVMFSDGVFEVMSQQTLKAKEEFLLSLVKSGHCSVIALSDHLGLANVGDVPDDIALFTVARAR